MIISSMKKYWIIGSQETSNTIALMSSLDSVSMNIRMWGLFFLIHTYQTPSTRAHFLCLSELFKIFQFLFWICAIRKKSTNFQIWYKNTEQLDKKPLNPTGHKKDIGSVTILRYVLFFLVWSFSRCRLYSHLP